MAVPPDPPPRRRQAHARREVRRELRARRRELRRKLAQRRQAMRRELDRRRKASPADRDRRLRRLLAALLLFIGVLLFRTCRCPPPEPPEEPEQPPPAEPAEAPPPSSRASSTPAPTGAIPYQRRPAFSVEAPEPLPWLASFRMQVSARSPRLAACFVDADTPGSLRWTAAIEPDQGRVSDPVLEPTLGSDALTRQQRTCVIEVLSNPPYRLTPAEARATPVRVGVVIEF